MNKKKSTTAATSVISLPIIAFFLYQLIKNIHSEKFLLSLIALVAVICSYVLIILSFNYNPRKQNERFSRK